MIGVTFTLSRLTRNDISTAAFSSHARTNITVSDPPTVDLTKRNETPPTGLKEMSALPPKADIPSCLKNVR
jgi:hypothetical protein